MVELIKKAEQLNGQIFDGHFHTNKPVAQGVRKELQPYSNIFYWSHARASGACEFDIHGHEGFEIMTFIWEGENAHFDTVSQRWTSLTKGGFQVIQTGKGLRHAERLIAGTRSFQVWFDPDFERSMLAVPAYKDYHIGDWEAVEENGFETNYFMGGNSPATCATERLIIRKLNGKGESSRQITLSEEFNYHFYQLNGHSQINDLILQADDVVKVNHIKAISVSISDLGELFLIQTPVKLTYQPIWEQ